MRSAPMAARRGARVSAVSFGAIASSCCWRMSPVSRPASMRMVVTPVTVSPLAIAHWMGAAARADDDDGVGLKGGEWSAEFVVGLDAVGLGDGKIQAQGGFFHGRGDEF